MAVEYTTNGNPDGAVVGTTAADKVGFYGATPVVQPTALADVTPAADGTAVGTAFNTLLAKLRTLGIIAT